MEQLQLWLKEHSQGELARKLGITQGAISQWLDRGEVPLARVREVERVTGIPAAALRPDVFGSDAEHRVAS